MMVQNSVLLERQKAIIDIQPLKLSGAYLITLSPIEDARGYFVTTYKEDLFQEHGITADWVQENQSLSTRIGVIRGLHFQYPPHAERKLVRVLQGRMLDVIVDLRKDSETYGQWASVELGADLHNMVYVPKGFGHGFCTLTENVLLSYKVDAYYAPQAVGGVRWNDPDIGVPWPCTDEPLLSEKDQGLPFLADFDSPF